MPTQLLADRIEQTEHALTAPEIAVFLSLATATVFKMARAGRIPSFRIGSAVRFDPRIVAQWLRSR